MLGVIKLALAVPPTFTPPVPEYQVSSILGPTMKEAEGVPYLEVLLIGF